VAAVSGRPPSDPNSSDWYSIGCEEGATDRGTGSFVFEVEYTYPTTVVTINNL